jgi:fumarate hydratase class II
MSIIHRRVLALLAVGALALGGTAVPAGAASHSHWSKSKCSSSYKAWKKKHSSATSKQRKAEVKKLHKLHGCSSKLH